MTQIEFALFRLDEAYRERHGIPDAYVSASMPLGANLPPDALLRLLQEHAASWSGWQTLEPLWDRLIARLGRDAPPVPVLDVETADWSLRVGPVDLDQGIVTLQRSGHLLAAVVPRPDGRLVASTYRPLDARALSMLTGIAMHPAPDGTVAMRPNNWEYALDQSAGTGQAYAAAEGVTYLSYWECGLGVSRDGNEVEEWRAQRSLTPRPAPLAAAELRAFARWPEPPKLKLSLASKPSVADAVTIAVPAIPREPSTLLARVRGCLLGGAVGDALGAPVEFLSLPQIRERFGLDGIATYAPAYGRAMGAITDDTQMTLFTAEGLLRSWVRGCLKGICHPPGIIHHAYLRWLLTQRERPRSSAVGVGTDGWLFGLPEMHARRAPGNTCLSALREAEGFGLPLMARNDSKGCGGVMRVAPIGLFGGEDPDVVFGLAADAAALTHGHPAGFLSAGHFATTIHFLRRGLMLDGALDLATDMLRGREHSSETVRAVEAGRALAAHGRPTPEQIETLGGGWVAEEAPAIALCCALSAKGFADGVLLAANHSGDSDSTAAMAGNLLGTLLGEGAIPGEFLDRLELRGEIASLAGDLHDAMTGALGPEAAWDRYPGW